MDKIGSVLGGLFGIKQPKTDPVLAAAQKQSLQTEQNKANDLGAAEAAQRSALESGRTGRALLAFAPPANTQPNLGG
jgi:hypothetical protein